MLPVQAVAGADAFLTRLEQGVLETNAEACFGRHVVRWKIPLRYRGGGRPGTEWLTIKSARDPPGPGRLAQGLACELNGTWLQLLCLVPQSQLLRRVRIQLLVACRSNYGQTLAWRRGWGQTTSVNVFVVAGTSALFLALCFVKKGNHVARLQVSIWTRNCASKGLHPEWLSFCNGRTMEVCSRTILRISEAFALEFQVECRKKRRARLFAKVGAKAHSC